MKTNNVHSHNSSPTEAAYKRLQAPEHITIQASEGRLFNNTFFGRDSAIESLLLLSKGYDIDMATQVAISLAELQGTRYRRSSNEEPGRIHHELRDFTKWQAPFFLKLGFQALSYVWGGNSKRWCTYFSQDATGLFIQLVEQCVIHKGEQFLQTPVSRQDGRQVTMADCVRDAAAWICSKQTDSGLIASKRSNRLSLYFQVFEDSMTSYKDQNGTLANVSGPLAFLEVQNTSVSGLLAASRLFYNDKQALQWQARAKKVADATMQYMWSDKDNYFVGAVEIKNSQPHKQVNSIGINAGWLLGSSLVGLLGQEQQQKVTTAIAKRLFADDFLTNAGIRSRSLLFSDRPEGVAAYHGSHTVWPLCTFIVAEGLRDAGLYKLADELDARIINSLNIAHTYPEFFIVMPDGQLVNAHTIAKPSYKTRKVALQMKPEERIGLSIITALIIERRDQHGSNATQAPALEWINALENEILRAIPHIKPENNQYMLQRLLPYEPHVQVTTGKGRRKTAYYLISQLFT